MALSKKLVVPTYYPRYRLTVWRRPPPLEPEPAYVEPPPSQEETPREPPRPAETPVPVVRRLEAESQQALPDRLPAPEKPLVRCRCGYDKNHHFVRPQSQFTLMGWFLIMMMINPRPRRILYTCARCKQVVDVVDDPAEIDNHTW